MITDDDLAKTLDRIARTADGELLYLYFQRVLMELSLDPSDSALRAHAGRRSLAGELIGRMAKGIEENGGRADQSDGSGGRRERPIVFRSREPAAVGRRESPREFIRRTELSSTGTDD